MKKVYNSPETKVVRIQMMSMVAQSGPERTETPANPTYDMETKYRNNGAWNSLW